jgi:hypothetical protein
MIDMQGEIRDIQNRMRFIFQFFDNHNHGFSTSCFNDGSNNRKSGITRTIFEYMDIHPYCLTPAFYDDSILHLQFAKNKQNSERFSFMVMLGRLFYPLNQLEQWGQQLVVRVDQQQNAHYRFVDFLLGCKPKTATRDISIPIVIPIDDSSRKNIAYVMDGKLTATIVSTKPFSKTGVVHSNPFFYINIVDSTETLEYLSSPEYKSMLVGGNVVYPVINGFSSNSVFSSHGVCKWVWPGIVFLQNNNFQNHQADIRMGSSGGRGGRFFITVDWTTICNEKIDRVFMEECDSLYKFCAGINPNIFYVDYIDERQSAE